MPVRERSGEPEPKRCKHCHESTHSSGPEGASWRLTLDEDLVQTLSAIYPEWFGAGSMGGGTAAGGGAPPPPPPPPPPPLPQQNHQLQHHRHEQQPQQQQEQRVSPPKATVDASPLQQAMDKNKESLKVKLMLRRPLNQLVAQGIMPPLKTPPAFHEQRKQLERAKTGDLLKAKIQKRPDRQELERRHILEQQEGHVDPSLAEKQRMLKKARLADQLNDQLSHRPGPLELIQKNILHTEEPIERAVKEGLVPFKATCEGALRRPEHPSSYQTLEEDSPAEEGSPPLQLAISPPNTLVVTSTPVTFHAVLPPPTISLADLCQTTLVPIATSPVSITSSTSTLSPLSLAASPPAPVTPRPVPSPLHVTQHQVQRSDAPGKDKNRKKSKSKAAPKARTIKFHEYKGPPNANKSSSPPGGLSGNQSETSYELLLRQQQLFLQWQLEVQHKYPQIILPATHKHAHMVASPAPSMAPDSPESSTSSVHVHQVPTPPPPPPPPSGRLEEMKVSDLKAELKRRNLPVSGPKPNLIERLRPFLSESNSSQASDESQDKLSSSVESLNHIMQSPVTSPESQTEAMDVESQPPTPQPQNIQFQPTGEDIVKEQQRKIEELQRELHKSKLQLQQIRAQSQGARQEPTPQDAKANRKLAIHHLQAKIQSHQLALHIQQLEAMQARQGQQSNAAAEKRQQEHREFQRRNSPGPNLPLPIPTQSVVPVAVTAPEPPRYMLSPKPVSSDQLLQLITTQPGGEPLKMQFTIKDGLNGLNGLNGKKNVGLVLNGVKVVPITILPSNPPPQYEEATRNKPSPPPPPPPPPPLPAPPAEAQPADNIIKSEIDDVLEILIKNGELPASAAHIPHSNSQNILNHNTDFLNTDNSLHNDALVHNNNQNELMNQNIHDNLQGMIHHNHIHNMDHSDLHNEFLNQNSSHSEIMNQNNLHNDLLNENDLHKNYLNQNNLLLNESNSQGSPHEHNSVLDELINANSMDSVQNMSENIMGSHEDYRHLTDFSNSHMMQIKDEDLTPDHSQHMPEFDALSGRCENGGMNLFKTEIFSDDSVQRPMSHGSEMNIKEQNQMEEGFNVEQLLGDDAHDGLDLKTFDFDLEGLDSMDFGQNECSTNTMAHTPGGTEGMDMDELFDSLWSPQTQQCDPLLGAPPRPTMRATSSARPPSHLSWDKVDFATT